MKITVYSVALLASSLLSGRASAVEALVDVVSVTPVKEIVNEPHESCGTECRLRQSRKITRSRAR
jgi:hypothetical protein